MQFVSHLFCFPSIRRKGALRPPRRKCPCEGLWVHRGSCRFNLPDQSFPFLPCTVRALNVITTALCDFTYLFIFYLGKPKNNVFNFFLGCLGLGFKCNNDASLCLRQYAIWNVIVPCLLTAVSSGDRNSEGGNKKESETTPQRY